MGCGCVEFKATGLQVSGAVAQLGARLLGVEKVGGSNPPSSTVITKLQQRNARK